MTILRAATNETELGDHDFYLSGSHYTDTDPTSRERAATAKIKSVTSSPESRALPTELPRPPEEEEEEEEEEEGGGGGGEVEGGGGGMRWKRRLRIRKRRAGKEQDGEEEKSKNEGEREGRVRKGEVG